MLKVKSLFRFLFPVQRFAPDDFASERRFYFFYSILWLAFFYLFFFSVSNFKEGNLVSALVEGLSLLLLVVLYYLLRKTKKIRIISAIYASIVGVLLVFIFARGGFKMSGFIHIFIFPSGACYLLTKNRGALASIGLFLCIALLYAFNIHNPNFPQYDQGHLVVAAAVYLVLLIVSYFITSISDFLSHKLLEHYSTTNEKLVVRDNFFRTLAHDLRGTVGFYSESLAYLKNQYKSIPDDEYLTYIDALKKSAEKNYSMLEHMLKWAEMQKQRSLIIFKITFSIDEIVHDVVELYRPLAEKKRISLRQTESSGARVKADVEMIKSVMRNFVSNALKFTHSGGTVSVKTHAAGGALYFSVTDNGEGVEKSKQGELFDVESKFTTRGTNNEVGSGLGLIICKDYINQNGGEIGLHSEKGLGSTFFFSLPLAV